MEAGTQQPDDRGGQYRKNATEIKHFTEDPELADRIMGFTLPSEWVPGETSLEEALEKTRRFWTDPDSGAMPKDFVEALNRSLGELVQNGLDTQSVQEGQAFPEFELPDQNGRMVSSKRLLEQGPIVLTFYRGGWCPYCNLALRALQAKLPEMKEADASLVAVSPELPDGTLSTAEQNALQFSVLSDVGLKLADQVGVVWDIPDYAMEWHQKFFGMDLEASNGDGNRSQLPVPATFVIGQDGLVQWRFVEAQYWNRANPDDVVAALKSLSDESGQSLVNASFSDSHRFSRRIEMDQAHDDIGRTRYSSELVDGVRVFYREAGEPQERAVVLLHGFPASSHMYREVLDSLGDEYYVIAPDYPGFGNSDFPDPKDYEYTFNNLAKTIEAMLEQKGIKEWVLGIQDYGAPVGFRLATKHPEKVKGLIVMNGNAYEEGFDPESSAPVRSYWESRTTEKEDMIAGQLMSLEGVKWQYTQGTRNPDGINPDNWSLDFAKLQRPGQREVQLDLFYDYRTNVELYPEWHAYLQEKQPRTLIAWGKRDPIFIEAGAEAYRQHLDNPEIHLFDTGHFVLEEDAPRVVPLIRNFLRDSD